MTVVMTTATCVALLVRHTLRQNKLSLFIFEILHYLELFQHYEIFFLGSSYFRCLSIFVEC